MMERRSFLARLALGIGLGAIAPKLFASMPPAPVFPALVGGSQLIAPFDQELVTRMIREDLRAQNELTNAVVRDLLR